MARRELSCWIVLATILVAPASVYAQANDTLVVKQRTSHSASSALWRSALIPGLGQVYNRQPLKAPIIVAGLVGLTVLAVHNDNEFDRYNRAYLYGAYINEDPHPFPDYEAEYLQFPGISTSALRSRRDGFRRNRDLTIIGIVVAYGFNLLDAYVSGQLFDFDVGEDLSSQNGRAPNPLFVSYKVRF